MANNRSSKFRRASLFSLSFLAVCGLIAGCSTTQKKTPELSKLEGKKVALVEISGEPTAKRIIETALVNQLLRTGSFILVSKPELQAARAAPDLNSMNRRALAQKVGADYALSATVLRFNAKTQEGYSSEIIEDSQLAAERGDGKTERLYKVQSLDTEVQVQLEFMDVQTAETRIGIAEAKDQVIAEAKESAIHLPPKMRQLEKVAQKAFHDFFERYR